MLLYQLPEDSGWVTYYKLGSAEKVRAHMEGRGRKEDIHYRIVDENSTVVKPAKPARKRTAKPSENASQADLKVCE